jgi:ketosteroid isomerase-like protein
MTTEDELEQAEGQFFDALLRSDAAELAKLLDPEFLLIDVITGSEIPGHVLVDVVRSGQLVFDSIERVDRRVRLYPYVSIVTGQTRIRGRVDRDAFETHSRYTHVYVPAAGGWRLVSAQGTPIASVSTI